MTTWADSVSKYLLTYIQTDRKTDIDTWHRYIDVDTCACVSMRVATRPLLDSCCANTSTHQPVEPHHSRSSQPTAKADEDQPKRTTILGSRQKERQLDSLAHRFLATDWVGRSECSDSCPRFGKYLSTQNLCSVHCAGTARWLAPNPRLLDICHDHGHSIWNQNKSKVFWGVKRRCSNEGLRTFPYNFQVWAKHCFMCTLQRSCMHESSGFSCLSSSGRARFVCKIDVSVNVFCNLFKKKRLYMALGMMYLQSFAIVSARSGWPCCINSQERVEPQNWHSRRPSLWSRLGLTRGAKLRGVLCGLENIRQDYWMSKQWV